MHTCAHVSLFRDTRNASMHALFSSVKTVFFTIQHEAFFMRAAMRSLRIVKKCEAKVWTTSFVPTRTIRRQTMGSERMPEKNSNRTNRGGFMKRKVLVASTVAALL